MQQMLVHKHYVGAAHAFEIVVPENNTSGEFIRPDVTILKTFFIDDTVNLNDWQATWEGLKKDAHELPGTPLVLQEDLEHPSFSVQKYFDRGTIFDYEIDEQNHKIIVYVRITDPTIIDRIKSGELEYVSPAVIPKGSEHAQMINGVDVLDRTLPLHLAIVGEPAYGKDKAKMTHLCSGNGTECLHRLKIMKAASTIYKAGKDCVSNKIQIIKREKPNISNEQAAAIAYSMCSESEKASLADAPNDPNPMDPLSQTPLIKKMLAKTARVASKLDQIKYNMKYAIYQGREGRWIEAQGMDVFVARNQSIGDAMREQCGCTALNN